MLDGLGQGSDVFLLNQIDGCGSEIQRVAVQPANIDGSEEQLLRAMGDATGIEHGEELV